MLPNKLQQLRDIYDLVEHKDVPENAGRAKGIRSGIYMYFLSKKTQRTDVTARESLTRETGKLP